MANVLLDFCDLEAEELPDVCMRCGAPSTVRPVKTFWWRPYWARFFMGIFGLAFAKRRRVPTPLCDRHKNHWTICYLVGFGVAALCVLPFILVLILFASNVEDDPRRWLTMFDLLMACGGLLFLSWLITRLILYLAAISVVEITDDTILLTNVCPKFAEAYRDRQARRKTAV